MRRSVPPVRGEAMADYRVLAACIMHETNTFSRQRTDLPAFRRRDFHIGEEIPAVYRGTRSAMGATFEAAERFGWIVAHPVCAAANPSGPVTRHAFETLMDLLLGCAQEQAPIAGALLHLHGAMVTQDHEDGDGELLARLRQVLGAEAPIVATLDPHAN